MKSAIARIRQWITPRRLLRLAGELFLILVLMLGLEWYLTRDAARGPAPEMEVTLIDGTPFALTELQGGPAVVYFWATWCPVCRVERGAVDALVSDYPVVTVAMQSGDAQAVSAYLADAGLDWRVVLDEYGEIAQRWGVVGVPAMFIIDSGGEIAFVARGYTSGIGLRLRLWLASLGGEANRSPPAR